MCKLCSNNTSLSGDQRRLRVPEGDRRWIMDVTSKGSVADQGIDVRLQKGIAASILNVIGGGPVLNGSTTSPQADLDVRGRQQRDGTAAAKGWRAAANEGSESGVVGRESGGQESRACDWFRFCFAG